MCLLFTDTCHINGPVLFVNTRPDGEIDGDNLIKDAPWPRQVQVWRKPVACIWADASEELLMVNVINENSEKRKWLFCSCKNEATGFYMLRDKFRNCMNRRRISLSNEFTNKLKILNKWHCELFWFLLLVHYLKWFLSHQHSCQHSLFWAKSQKPPVILGKCHVYWRAHFKSQLQLMSVPNCYIHHDGIHMSQQTNACVA